MRSTAALFARVAAGIGVAALVACFGVDSRIHRQQAVFDRYPSEVQQNIRNGIIEVGYTPEMVAMALGEPDRKLDAVDAEVMAQIWTYTRSVPGFSIGWGNGTYVGSHVGIGTGVTLGEPPRSEDRAIVEFRGGRVLRFEAIAPR